MTKEFKNPTPTVDAIITRWNADSGKPEFLIIQRANAPYGYALVGGFVDEGESYENAIKREVREEVSIEVELQEQFHTYSNPDRDPRQHIASTVYHAEFHGEANEAVAADDAKSCEWVPHASLFRMLNDDGVVFAFDHRQILKDFIDIKFFFANKRAVFNLNGEDYV